jgi:hypothetical protein
MKLYRAFAAGVMILFLGTICHAETKAAPQTAKNLLKKTAPTAKIDLNAATQAELEKLPGIGPALAKKIIAGRPYASTADIAKAGLPVKTISKITPLVSVGAVPSTAKKAVPQSVQPSAPSKAPQAIAPAKIIKQVTPPPAGANMVWVNKESKIYHKPGSQWYGKTGQGSYMPESEAIKAGYRESKSKAK